MAEEMRNITEEAQAIDTQEVPVEEVTGVVDNGNASLNGLSKAEAQRLIESCRSIGVEVQVTKQPSEDKDGNDIVVYNCTLLQVTDHQLDVIARKTNIATWRDNISTAANKVGNFAEDVGDFALNGALVPTAVSVANCAGKVAPVVAKAAITTGIGVGTAAIHAGAEILTTTIQSGTKAYHELSNDDSIKQAGKELKGLWSNVTSKLFGSTGNTKFTRC